MSDGKALIFSAPSGSGKTTIVKHLVNKFPQLAFSISATTRKPRKGLENVNKDYYFLTEEDFSERVNNGRFIEWEEVYKGTRYGTLKSEIDKIWREGKAVIFDVDVRGGLNLKKYFGDKAMAVFVRAPDVETLAKRLVARQTETEADLKKRLEKAADEMSFQNRFDEVIVNENLEESLLNAEKLTEKFLELN